jgi:hypothetical protein
MLVDHVCIQHAILLQIMRNRILGQKWRLQPNLGPNPLAFRVWGIGRMITTSAAAELRTEVCALNLIKLFDPAPGFIAHRAGNVDFQSYHRHKQNLSTTEARSHREAGENYFLCVSVVSLGSYPANK